MKRLFCATIGDLKADFTAKAKKHFDLNNDEILTEVYRFSYDFFRYRGDDDLEKLIRGNKGPLESKTCRSIWKLFYKKRFMEFPMYPYWKDFTK